MFFLVFFFTIFILFFKAKKVTNYYFIMLLGYFCIYLFPVSFTIIRQGIVLSLSAFSIRYIKEKKFFKFLTIIILGSFFHSSILIVLPFYFFANKNYSKKVLFAVILFCLVLTRIDIVSLVFKYLGFMLPKFFYYKLKVYTYELTQFRTSEYVKLFKLFVKLLVCLLGILIKDRVKDKYFNISLNACIYGLIIYSFFYSSNLFASRLSFNLEVFSLYLYPYFVNVFDKESKGWIYLALVLYFCSLFLYFIYKYKVNFLPYKTIFGV